MRVCVCALARVCALPLEREEVKMKSFFLVSTIEAFSQNERQKQNPKLIFCACIIKYFCEPYHEY